MQGKGVCAKVNSINTSYSPTKDIHFNRNEVLYVANQEKKSEIKREHGKTGGDHLPVLK